MHRSLVLAGVALGLSVGAAVILAATRGLPIPWRRDSTPESRIREQGRMIASALRKSEDPVRRSAERITSAVRSRLP